MTLVFISENAVPAYTALSTDIVDGKISGAVLVGKLVYTTDDTQWYIINKDLTLSEYVLPVEFSGSISVGAVNQGSAGVNPWPVSISSGENHVGSIGGASTSIDITPTLTVHANYVSGDFVGTSTTPMTITSAARVNGGTGTILSAVLIDRALQSISAELWLFDATITPPADSAAWSLSDADMAKCIGVIPFTTYYASALNSISFSAGIGIGFKAASDSRDIFACLVTRGAPTYASGDLTVRLNIWQD